MNDKSLKSELLKIAAEQYGTKPEYLWAKYPGHAVLRHSYNKKWYAVLMNVSKDKLGLSGSGSVDIINLKTDPFLAASLRMKEGFLPAYHMNKESWITILLDGTVDIKQITDLLDMSFGLTGSKAKSKRPGIRNTDWIVPANPKYYDIESAIQKSTDGTFSWKQSNHICVGDTVYLYIAAPVSAIRYKCQAVEVNIPYEYSDDNLHMSRVMRLKLLEEYDKTSFGIEMLKTHGVYAVRGPRSMPNSLKEKINQS